MALPTLGKTYSMTADQYVAKLTAERDEARQWWEYWRAQHELLQHKAGRWEGETYGLRRAVDALELAIASLREKVQELEQVQAEVATKTPATAVPALMLNGPGR